MAQASLSALVALTNSASLVASALASKSFAFSQVASARFGRAAMHDHRERVHGLAVDEDVHLHKIAVAMPDLVIVETGITARNALQPVVEIEDHLVERQFIDHLCAAADIGQVLLDASPVLT